MKKILVLVIGLLGLFSSVEPAFGEEIAPLTLGKTTVQYNENGTIYAASANNPQGLDTALLDGNRNSMASFYKNRYFTVNLDQVSDIKKIHAEMLGNYSKVNKLSVSFYRNKDAVDLIQTMQLTGTAIYSNNVDVRNVQSIRVKTSNADADNMRDFIAYGISSPVEHVEITGLTNNTTIDSVRLNWTNPEVRGFVGVNVYRDDILIREISQPETTFTDNNVEEGETYTYKVTSKFTDGHETPGIITNVVVPRTPVLRITDLTHSEDYTKVRFEWTNPRDSTFQNIRIYRDNRIRAGNITGNTFTDDYEIRPGTTYNYKFEIVNNAGRVFSGGELSIDVPEAPPAPVIPPPVIEGGGFEQQPNGDYTATWETPVTGEIRVYVGGNLYRTVPASSQSITIPAADMVYTFIGDPDVRLQPVSEDGIEGETESPPPSVDTPFSVEDLIGSGSSLFLYVAPFLLLALSFLLVPKLRNMIFSSLGKKKEEKENVNSERRTENDENKEPINSLTVKEKEERKVKRERKEQDKGKEHLAKIEKIESKEIQKQEKKAERKREPRESRIRSEKQIRYPREARMKREPRERFRNVREGREEREPRKRRER